MYYSLTLMNKCCVFITVDGIYGGYRMIRNKDRSEGQPSCVFVGDKPEYDDSKFILEPVKAGLSVRKCKKK